MMLIGIVLFVIPLVGFLGYRGEKFHWFRILPVYAVSFLTVYALDWVDAKTSIDYIFKPFVLLFPIISVVGFYGGEFHADRFGADKLALEIKSLFNDRKSALFTIFVIYAASMNIAPNLFLFLLLPLGVVTFLLSPIIISLIYRDEKFHTIRVLPVIIVNMVIFYGLEINSFTMYLGFVGALSISIGGLVGYLGERYNFERLLRNQSEEVELLFKKSSFKKVMTGFAFSVFLITANSVPTIVLLVIVIIIAGGVYFVRSRLKKNKISVEKDREDLLVTDSLTEEVLKKANHPEGIFAGSINGEPVFASTQDRAVVIGPPGTGKTTFLVSQLLKWAESGRSFVCMDIKPEIYGITRSKLEEQGYKLYAYNPTSGKGHRYNILDDAISPEQIGELADSLIPTSDEKNIIFSASARDFLDAIITHLKNENKGSISLPDVRAFVTQFDECKELLNELRRSGSNDVREIVSGLKMTASNERLLGSIFSTLTTNLRFLRYPSIKDSMVKSDFSLSELKGKKVGIFLQFEEKTKSLTSSLASVLVGHIMRYLITNVDREPVFQIFDEVGNMAPIIGLKEKLNTIRSRNMPTWLYWQSKEQMQGYGDKQDEGPNIILGACDFQMVYRLNDNATATWFSEKIGTVDRVVKKDSHRNSIVDLFGAGTSSTKSEELVTEAVIKPHELQQLEDGEVVCTYRGKSWKGKAQPYYEIWPEYKNRKPSSQDCVGSVYLKVELS